VTVLTAENDRKLEKPSSVRKKGLSNISFERKKGNFEIIRQTQSLKQEDK
jgi:hypothetical protein